MIQQLSFSRVSFTYDSLSAPLFTDLSVIFPPGWTALAGVNGSGKTTLLSLAMGTLVPDSGSISGNGDGNRGNRAAGDGARPGHRAPVYLGQEMERPPAFFEDPSLIAGPESLGTLSRLGIGDDWPWRWETLSGGERRRALVADALLKRPELLVLDEPTNHVDASALRLISSALSSFRGTGIAVSHNVEFLDSLCARTVILKRAGRGVVARTYDCGPSRAFEADRADDDRRRAERVAMGQEAARIRAQGVAAAAEVARGKKRLSKRGLDAKDHDGKGKIDAARVTGKDAGAGAKVAKLAARLERKTAELNGLDAPLSRKSGASFSGARSRSDALVRLSAGTLSVGDGALLIDHPDLVLAGGDRVAITGDNGAGKTSLLLALMGRLAGRGIASGPGSGTPSVAYLPQEFSRAERAALLERLRSLDDRARSEAISLSYRLGAEPSSMLEAEVASPGETKKLALALAMTGLTHCLVLDEPTNHLDALSATLLAEALSAYEGAILAVTHDRAFMRLAGCAEWRMERAGNRSKLTPVSG